MRINKEIFIVLGGLILMLVAFLSVSCSSIPTEGDEEGDDVPTTYADMHRVVFEDSSNREFLKKLNALSTDSLFRIGTKYVTGINVVPDTALMIFLTGVAREEKVSKDTLQMAAIAKSYVNMGYVYSSVYHNYTRSFSNYKRAEDIALKYGFEEVLANVYMNMAVTLSSESSLIGKSKPGEESEEIAKYLRRAYSLAEKTCNREVMDFTIYNMVSGPEVGEVDSTYHYIQRYMSSGPVPVDSLSDYLTYVCKGIIAYANKDYAEAHSQFSHYDSARHNVKRLLPRLREQAKYLDAMTFEAEGDIGNARELLVEVLEEAVKRNDLECEMAYSNNLYLFEQKHGSPDVASAYLLNFYRVRDKLASMSTDMSISEMQLQEKLRQFEKELTLSRVQERNMRWIVFTVTAIAVLIIAILLIVIHYSRRQREYIMTLYEKHLQSASPSLSRIPTPKDSEDNGGVSLPNPIKEGVEVENEIKVNPELVKEIEEVMEKSCKIFDPEFQMTTLCAMLGSNVTYVSQAVNFHYGKPFKNVLTELRIAEACRRLDNPIDNASYSIEGICQEVGFKSRSAFSVAFKNITGLTPSQYRKAAQKYMPPKES